MQHLISDLLAYTTARDLTINPVRVDLAAVVADVARARIEANRVRDLPEPVITVDPDLPAGAGRAGAAAPGRRQPDRQRGQVRRTRRPPGDPGLRPASPTARSARWSSSRSRTTASASPTGQHDQVFDSFHRAHKDGYRGTGLGLSIVKRIVERHGGTASARDRDGGGGTTMTVTFPAAKVADGLPDPTQEQ